MVWNDGTFLFPDSHFTVTLTDVSYQGPGGTCRSREMQVVARIGERG